VGLGKEPPQGRGLGGLFSSCVLGLAKTIKDKLMFKGGDESREGGRVNGWGVSGRTTKEGWVGVG